MNQNSNVMILNNKNIGIKKIELNKSDLLITDKSGKHCLKVLLLYNWNDISSIKVGEKKSIEFNEYCFSENNESALVNPSKCNVEKMSNTSLCFDIEFNDLSTETTYMNQRERFDIELRSLIVKVIINYNDAKDGSVIYDF